MLEALRDPERSEGAWRQFVDLYGPLVYRFCRKQRLQDADAADVTQAIFLSLSRAFPQFQYDPSLGSFRSFLGAVAANAVRSHYRRTRRREIREGDGEPVDVAELGQMAEEWTEEFEAYVLAEALRRVRREFDQETWGAFEAVWSEHCAPSEVARRMQREPRWVYQAKYLVLKRLEAEVQRLSLDCPLMHR